MRSAAAACARGTRPRSGPIRRPRCRRRRRAPRRQSCRSCRRRDRTVRRAGRPDRWSSCPISRATRHAAPRPWASRHRTPGSDDPATAAHHATRERRRRRCVPEADSSERPSPRAACRFPTRRHRARSAAARSRAATDGRTFPDLLPPAESNPRADDRDRGRAAPPHATRSVACSTSRCR